MKRTVLAFAVVAVAMLVAGAPSMAADESPAGDPTSLVNGAGGPIDLVFEDRSPEGRREKPRPKFRHPGRQAMTGPQAECTNDGFLFDLLGLTGIVRTCADGEEDNGLVPRFR